MQARLYTALACAMFVPLLATARGPSEPPPVDRDSDAIRAVLAQPITCDPLPLFIAQQKLRFAKDEAGAKSIDLYLTTVAVRQVFGDAAEPKGTVADIVEGRVGAVPIKALVRRVLEGTLRAELGVEPLRHKESTGRLEVPITVRNLSASRVTEQEYTVQVGQQGGPTLRLKCDESAPIGPHEAVSRICTTNSSVIPRRQLEPMLKEPGWINIAVTRLEFDKPKVAVNIERVLALEYGGSESYATARSELEALGCKERGTCLREAVPTLDSNPMVVFAATFAAAGLVSGTIIALFTRRRWRWGWGLAGLVGGSIVVAIVGAFMANSMMAFVLLIYGPAAFGGFILGLIPVLTLVKGRHPE